MRLIHLRRRGALIVWMLDRRLKIPIEVTQDLGKRGYRFFALGLLCPFTLFGDLTQDRHTNVVSRWASNLFIVPSTS